MGRVEEEAAPVGPHGWASPDLGPEVSTMRRSVGFLQTDNIGLALSAKEGVEFAPGGIVTNPPAVKGANR